MRAAAQPHDVSSVGGGGMRVWVGRGSFGWLIPFFLFGVGVDESQAGAVGMHRAGGGEPWVAVGVRNSKRGVTDAGRLGIDEDEGGGRSEHLRCVVVMIFDSERAAADRRDVVVHRATANLGN